jgi:hypothetical protein
MALFSNQNDFRHTGEGKSMLFCHGTPGFFIPENQARLSKFAATRSVLASPSSHSGK